jgi:cysteine synthase B
LNRFANSGLDDVCFLRKDTIGTLPKGEKMKKRQGSNGLAANHYVENWLKFPLPVVPIADELNPFVKEGVELYAAVAYHLPYENIKFPTVYGLLSEAKRSGVLKGVHTLVEATSGSTGVTLASLAKSYGDFKVQLVVSPDIPDGKRYPLVMAGAELIPPEENLSGIATARKLGGGGWRPVDWHAQNGKLNLDQYANPAGAKYHELFTGPKILEQLPAPPTVFVTSVGTGGTVIGISKYLRSQLENISIVGTFLSPGHEIPGIRDLNRMKEISLPWRQSIDEYLELAARPSYLASLWFNWVMGLAAGPSSGIAYLGALRFIRQKKTAKKLDALRDHEGKIRVAILFPDGNRPYGDRFTANVPTEYFRRAKAPLPWQFPGYELW